MQLSLTLLEIAVPEARVWEALTPDQQTAVIELLGRLLAKAVLVAPRAEGPGDE